MNEIDFFNLTTTAINTKMVELAIDPTRIKWPNTDVDMSKADWYVEILITQYPNAKIALKGSKRRFGCVTIKVMSDRGKGASFATELAEKISESLSNKIINAAVFDMYEIKTLDHTLSQRQTTTDIPKFQVNSNIDYTYVR